MKQEQVVPVAVSVLTQVQALPMEQLTLEQVLHQQLLLEEPE
jgi:hypothetical protein